MKNFLFRISALAAVLVYSANILFAADYAKTFMAGQRTLNLYLERAACQNDQAVFERMADEGIAAALFEWEQGALELKLLGFDEWTGLREALERDLESEAKAAYERWLLEKESLEIEGAKKSGLYEELQKAAKDFYFTDADGNASRIVSKENIYDAKAAWEKEAEKIVQKYLDENSREEERADLYFVEEKVCNALMNELLYDHSSLKKASDSQAALTIADKLASQIEGESGRAVERLFNSLETEAKEAGGGDVHRANEKDDGWLLQFERELEIGLQKWEDAEADFLSARSEWEKNAESLYSEDVKNWQDAYQELQARKEAWTKKIAAQIEDGEREWQKKFSDLYEELSEFMLEFQQSLALEANQKESLAAAHVSAYEQSRAILKTAQDGIDNWYARWSDKYNGLYSYWKTEDCEFGRRTSISSVSTNDLRNEVQEWKRDFVQSFQNFYSTQRSAFFYLGVLCDFSYPYELGVLAQIDRIAECVNSCSEFSSVEEIDKACRELSYCKFYFGANAVCDEYWDCLGMGSSLWTSSAELFDWLDLVDKYSAKADESLGALGDDAILDLTDCDDLSIEKKQAQSLLSSLNERVDILEELLDYSKNTYSDIDNAEKTEANLTAARERLAAAKKEYEEALALSSQKGLETELAKEKYSLAFKDALDAMEKLEAERQKYDQIYDERDALYKNFSYSALSNLINKYNSLNVSEETFTALLGSYSAFERQKEDEAFMGAALAVRDGIENGSQGMQADFSVMDGVDLGEAALEAKERILAQDALCPKSLSMERLCQICDALREIALSEVFDAEALGLILEDLALLDKDKADLLREKIDERDASGKVDPETEDALKGLCAEAERELENREAALLLLDGSAQEIHEFFDGNEDFAPVMEKYGQYSFALADEKYEAARASLAQAIDAFPRDSIDDYFGALDLAAEGLRPSDKKILSLYKKALEDGRNNIGKELAAKKSLQELGSFFSYKEIAGVNYYSGVYEEFFLTRKEREAASNFDEANFLEILDGRVPLLDEIEESAKFCLNPSKKYYEMTVLLSKQEAEIKRAREDYSKKLEEASGLSPESAVNVYSRLCDEYNLILEECAGLYEKVKDARFSFRLAEEIYFYGQNEYLRGDYDIQKKLDEAKARRDETKGRLEFLNAVQQEAPSKLLEEYKDSYVQCYKARALLYKHNKEVAAQKERLCKAQAHERAATDQIVQDAAGGAAFEIPSSAMSLVSVKLLPDGKYSFGLDGAGQNSEEKESLLRTYYCDKSVVQTDIYGSEYKCSQAKQDAIEFIDSLDKKPYSMTDLALAALRHKTFFDIFTRSQWLRPGEEPFINDNYKIGDLPDTVHGVDLASAYNEGRSLVIDEAYSRVLSAGGEEDVAKFILLSNLNISRNMEINQLQDSSLRLNALRSPFSATNQTAGVWQACAAVNFALAAVFLAISCIPAVGSWAEPVAACFTALAVSFQSVALKLWETLSDISCVMEGYAANLAEAEKGYNKYRAKLGEARASRQKESDILNLLVSGDEKPSSDCISWKEFKRSLDHLFEEDAKAEFSEYFFATHDSTKGDGTLRELFDQVTREEKFFTVGAVLERMAALLQENRAAKKAELDEYVLENDGKLTFNKAEYYKDLISFYSKDALAPMPVNYGQELEEYQADMISDCLNLRSEALMHSCQKKTDLKRSLCENLISDAQGLYESWNEKNSLLTAAAQREWVGAESKIEGDFNLWASEWNKKYKEANDDWAKSCEEFLRAKEDWISRQYQASAVDLDIGWSFAQKSQPLPKSRMDKYLDSLCDSEKFERFLRTAQNLSVFVKDADLAQSAFLSDKIDASLLKNLDKAMRASQELQNDMQAAAAKSALQAFAAQTEEAVKERLGAIDSQNEGLEKWELNMVRGSGYKVDPLIHRNAIVDSTLFSTKRETQWVHRYEWFVAPRPEFNFFSAAYPGTEGHSAMKKMEEFARILQSWTSEIFGDKDGAAKGKFKEHVGEAPVFVDKVDPRLSLDRNVQCYGSGQMGLIMLDYQWNSIRNSAGYAEFSKAVYDQQLFDIGLDGLKLPTLRDVASVVCEVFSTCSPLVFIKYVDDIVFGAADLALGYKTWDETVNSALRQAAIGAVSGAVGSAVNSIGSSIKSAYEMLKSGPGGAVFDAAQNAVAGYTTNVAAGYVNAFDFLSGRMDWERAAQAWSSGGALSGAASALAGGLMAAADSFDAQGELLCPSVFGGRANLNSIVGSLAGEAASYLATGDFSINLLGINGVGLLELGFRDGKFSAGFGRGGAYMSLDKIDAACAELQSVATVQRLKDGGDESRALLTASNLLGWSGGGDNLSLAKDLLDGKKILVFEAGAGESDFSRAGEGVIVLDSALLGQGKDGLLKIAAYSAYQNLLQKDQMILEKEKELLKMKKADGSYCGEKEMQEALNKVYTSQAMSSMAQTASVITAGAKLLGRDISSIGGLESFVAMTDAYSQAGMSGVYALYAEARSKAVQDGQGKLSFTDLMKQPWFQNEAKNLGVILGDSISADEYNKIARENAIERFVNQEVKNYCMKHGSQTSPAQLKEIEKAARAQAEKEIVAGVPNEKYSYKPEAKASDIYSYGCTLATAAYIAYAITGNVTTLSEANDILKEKDIFLELKDSQGVAEKNKVGGGDKYAEAVNAIAGADCLQKDGMNYSVSAVVYERDNRQSIFDRLVKNARNTEEVYFTHMRVGDGHSVLFDSLTYSDEKNYKTSTLSVLDPWQGGKYGPKSWNDITRADFYKLTQTGKDLYMLTQARSRLLSS